MSLTDSSRAVSCR